MPTSTSLKRPLENCSVFENNVLKRYGKKVKITGIREFYPSGVPKSIRVDIQSLGKKKYSLTECIREDGSLEKVILGFMRGKTQVEQIFPRYLDAEVGMIDLIADEI